MKFEILLYAFKAHLLCVFSEESRIYRQVSSFLKTPDDSQAARGEYRYEEAGQHDTDGDLCL